MPKESPVTLVLSEIAGELGETISMAESDEASLKSLILSKIPRPLSGDALKLSRENRELKIKQFVGKKITPPVANDLILQFCGEKALILSEGDYDDGFAGTIKALELMPDLQLSEKSGKQTLDEPNRPGEGEPDPYKEAMENATKQVAGVE